ncbi:thioredoxin family protein [Paraburkholderia adhaesiva]|uniref:thioredoxin family protein n=1 Tax=Paraburkholderia adhaesiva TaxID=2883244 RepID=UPI00357095EF
MTSTLKKLCIAVGACAALGVGVATFTTLPAASAAGDKTMQTYRSDLPKLGPLPSLDGASTWLNSPPLDAAQLRGKVVLVDFWTYSCINCIRTLPHVRAWAQKYRDQGLVVIGVHTPEFDFEKDTANISKAIARFQLDYPIAVDSDHRIWDAFHNNAWPVFYIADAQGQVRARFVGEGNYDKVEKAIQSLLAEAGKHDAMGALTAPQAGDEQASPDIAHLGSGETYVGYAQASNYVSRGGLKEDVAHDYVASTPGLNEWSFAGNWTVGAERASLNRAGGGIVYRFSARDLHLVLGPGAGRSPVRFQVTVDGSAPGANHGTDTDANGKGVVTETRLYQLVRQSGPVKEHTFEIRFLDPGVDAFAFTFG